MGRGRVKIIACQNTNDLVRSSSSSGGIFPLLAEEILAQEGVVYGAAFTPEFSIQHIRITDKKEIPALQSSKYAFGSLGTAYKDCKADLESGRSVLFSGTPCQIAGLKKFLQKEYDNLYLIDFICHGTPALSTWNQYLKELAGDKKILSVNFRDKRNGWTEYNLTVKFTDGTEYSVNHNEDPYLSAFVSEITLRNCCYRCQFKGVYNRSSDITLGDLWGAKELATDIFDDKGTSLLIVSTEKGEKLIHHIKNSIQTSEIDAEKAFSINWAAVKSAKPSIYKPLFDKCIKKHKALIPLLNRFLRPTFIQKCENKVYRKIHYKLQ